MAIVNFKEWLDYQSANPIPQQKLDDVLRQDLSDDEYRKKYVDVYGSSDERKEEDEVSGCTEECSRRSDGRRR